MELARQPEEPGPAGGGPARPAGLASLLGRLGPRSPLGSAGAPSRGGEGCVEDCGFVPAMGNFSIQYNFTSASIAVEILNKAVEEPAWSQEVTLPAAFLGCMFGMVTMGRLGDVIGCVQAMRVTLLLTVVGSLVPAMAFGSPDSTYLIVCLGRLLLGVGVGGIYPLSAVSSAHGGHGAGGASGRVARAFFWQSVGQVVPYLVAMALLKGMPVRESSLCRIPVWELWQFRLLFALGSVPACIVWLASLRDEGPRRPPDAPRRARSAVAASVRRQPREVLWTLAGTASVWFLYDVAFYGTAVFTPKILEAICLSGDKVGGTCEQSLYQTSLESVIVTLMGLPGALLAVAQVSSLGSKNLNVWGNMLIAVVFGVMGVVWRVDQHQEALLFVLFCLLQFLLSWGPNLGTYVLPAVCFPTDVQSTCHGLSAMGGKLGALSGALLFQPIRNTALGVPGVLCIQAAACLLGAAASQALLRHDWEYADAAGRRDQERLAG